ncbi:antirestriction Ral family protein [Escherichia coli]
MTATIDKNQWCGQYENKHCTVYSFQRVNTRSNVARN